MKKYILLLISVATLLGCTKVLETDDSTTVTDSNFWINETYAEMYLNKIYANVLPTFAGTSNTSLSCEAPGSGTGEMYGALTISDSYGIYTSSTVYPYIRRLNHLLAKIEATDFSTSVKAEIEGQAYFLRAWVYWQLVTYYGGVPLVLDAVDPNDTTEVMVARSSAKVCVTQITSDLNQAISLLPSSWSTSERGRVTRGAAAALKGRVLLFYASPQFNPNDLTERWDSAYTATKAAKDICDEDGYALYSNFARVFLDDNSEQIFFTVYDGVNKLHAYDNSVRPASQTVSGAGQTNNPTWELVKAFPMKNGLAVTDASSGYDTAYFWKNRDPRFYATIAYNAGIWGLSQISGRRQYTYYSNNQESSAKLSLTGFYCKKNIDTSVLASATAAMGTDWVEIRYAEVLLNLAECAARLGYLDEAKEQLVALRKRAGIVSSDGSYGISASTSTDMIGAVMTEREIELAFENKRYWDLRRRNMYIDDLTSSILKINGTRRQALVTKVDTAYIRSKFTVPSSTTPLAFFEANIRDTVDWSNNYFLYFSQSLKDAESTDIDYLQPQYNFFFIGQSELDKNSALKQTVNWATSNYFDPLAD
jgi:starch-binding outer membrane protein, SusD/RagB family